MANNIYTNYTLQQYNKKYRNRRHRLVKITKAEVERFDKEHPVNSKNYLLIGRKWALIGDTYYEIPKPVRFTWFRNLNAGVQTTICLLGAGVIATAVVVPTVISLKNRGDIVVDHKAVIDVETENVGCTQRKLDNGSLEVTLTYDTSKKELESLLITMGDQILNLNQDYTLTGNVIVINKEVLDNNKTYEITIKPTLKDITPEVIKVSSITITNTTTEVNVGEKLELTTKVLPENATNKELEWSMNGGAGGDAEFVKENNKIYLKGKTAGQISVIATAKDGSGVKGSKNFTIKASTKTVNVDDVSLNEALSQKGVKLLSVSKTVTSDSSMINIKYGTTTDVNVTLNIKNNKTIIQTQKVEFKSSLAEVSFEFTAWDKVKSGDTLTFEVVLSNKEKFIKLYNEYNGVYNSSTKIYDASDIPSVYYCSEDGGTATLNTSSVETEVVSGIRQTTINTTGSVSLRIDTNNPDFIDWLALLKDDDNLYYFNDDGSILYSDENAESDQLFLMAINKFGYVTSYFKCLGTAFYAGYQFTTQKDPHDPVVEKRIILDNTSLELTVGGESKKVTAYLSDSGTTEITYSVTEGANLIEVTRSDNTLTVSPKAKGNAIIMFSAEGYTSVYCNVTISEPATKKTITLSPAEFTINLAESTGTPNILKATLEDFEPSRPFTDVKFTVDETSETFISLGEITQDADGNIIVDISTKGITGKAYITVSCEGYEDAQCCVTIVNKSVNIDTDKISLFTDSESVEISASLSPEAEVDISFEISQESNVITVEKLDDNKFSVEPDGEGTAIITFSAEGYASANCLVTVSEKKEIELSDSEITITLGEPVSSLKVTLPDFEGDLSDVSFTLNEGGEEIIDIDDITEESKGVYWINIGTKDVEGEAEITVSCNGYTPATCKVIVQKGEEKVVYVNYENLRYALQARNLDIKNEQVEITSGSINFDYYAVAGVETSEFSIDIYIYDEDYNLLQTIKNVKFEGVGPGPEETKHISLDFSEFEQVESGKQIYLVISSEFSK